MRAAAPVFDELMVGSATALHSPPDHSSSTAAPIFRLIVERKRATTYTTARHRRRTSPYNGGPAKAISADGTARVDGPSVESVNATRRGIDGCGQPHSTTAGDVTTQTADCADGRTVELISVTGAGHQWPGGDPSPLARRLLKMPIPSTALNATDTIWQFLTSKHR
jgi:poly(3-hydroxybutyrate) depolymerase